MAKIVVSTKDDGGLWVEMSANGGQAFAEVFVALVDGLPAGRLQGEAVRAQQLGWGEQKEQDVDYQHGSCKPIKRRKKLQAGREPLGGIDDQEGGDEEQGWQKREDVPRLAQVNKDVKEHGGQHPQGDDPGAPVAQDVPAVADEAVGPPNEEELAQQQAIPHKDDHPRGIGEKFGEVVEGRLGDDFIRGGVERRQVSRQVAG